FLELPWSSVILALTSPFFPTVYWQTMMQSFPPWGKNFTMSLLTNSICISSPSCSQTPDRAGLSLPPFSSWADADAQARDRKRAAGQGLPAWCTPARTRKPHANIAPYMRLFGSMTLDTPRARAATAGKTAATRAAMSMAARAEARTEPCEHPNLTRRGNKKNDAVANDGNRDTSGRIPAMRRGIRGSHRLGLRAGAWSGGLPSTRGPHEKWPA